MRALKGTQTIAICVNKRVPYTCCFSFSLSFSLSGKEREKSVSLARERLAEFNGRYMAVWLQFLNRFSKTDKNKIDAKLEKAAVLTCRTVNG